MLHLQRAIVMIANKIRDAEHLTNRWSVEKEQGITACITPRKARPSWQSTRSSKKHEKKERKTLKEANNAAREERGIS